jgi:O-succinylbenzoic acid--CoA ligase
MVSGDYVTMLLAAVRPDDRDLPLESDEAAVVMATSGSTGSPRGVLLSADALMSMSTHANGTGRPQWIAALPLTSMGGMNVLLRALAADRLPIALPSIGGASPFTPFDFEAAVVKALAVTDDVRVSLVAAQVSRLLADERGIASLRQCASVLVGGGPARASMLFAASDLGIRLTTTYGATETAGGCVFDGRPLQGVRVTSSAVSAGDPGILTIGGPCIALGYRGLPEESARRFTSNGFVTSDLGSISADGSVAVIGRADDVVVINGVNVSPGAIERVVHDLPDVVSAAAVTLTPEDTEPVVWVFLEARDDAPEIDRVARLAVIGALGAAAAPTVRQVVRLPHLPNGKVDRLRLQRWATGDERMD